MVLGPLEGAAAGFAFQLGGNWWWGWLKRRRLAAVYRTAAAATIEHCLNDGCPERSDTWNAVTSLLLTEEKARQIARWYARHTIDSPEFQDMVGNDRVLGQFLQYFIAFLNQQRKDLLPLDLRVLADIIITETSRGIENLSHTIAETVRQEIRSTPESHSVLYWIGRPTTIGEGFIGREAELEALEKAFEECRAVVVSGGGGSGKSRMAAEYAHYSGALGFWTEAGNDVVPTIAALTEALGIDIGSRTDDELAVEVTRVLARMPSEILWVIDNLEGLEQVNSLLNAVDIRLLATTRDNRSQVLTSDTCVFRQLPVLDSESATKLLVSRSKSDPNDPALLTIVDLVGHLPLALEMLAIRLGDYGQTPETVLEQLLRVSTPIRLKKFQETGGTTIDRVEGVFNTIVGTLDNLAENVRVQISSLGYLAGAPIPQHFVSAVTGIEHDQLDAVIEACRQRSVVSVIDGQAIVHALTIAAIDATNVEGMLEITLSRALERLASINQDDPVALRRELIHHESILSQGRKTLGLENSVVFEVANNLANGYYTLGRYQEAIQLWQESLRIRQQVTGPEPLDILMSRTNLANGFRAVGRYQEAIQLDAETLTIREKVLGPRHPHTLFSRNNLALGYSAMGRYEEAIRLDAETLMIREQELGPQHPDSLLSRANLANAYRAMGRYEDAIQLDIETLTIREQVFGPEHPAVLSSRTNLANSYHALGNYREAIQLDAETLSLKEKILGPEHPETLGSRANLADSYRGVGNYQKAILLWEETFPIMEQVLGPVHPDTLQTRANLATGYHDVGRYQEAIQIWEETLGITEQVLGPEHPRCLQIRHNLAIGYRTVGRNQN